jgi:regulator of PEP synthase PpsR (kinase-PPPase family)
MKTINSALISAGAAIAVCVINQNRLISLIEYRLEQLEEKQNKYNNIIERTYELEKSEAVFKEKMGETIHRVDNLEEFHKPQ